MSTRHWLIAVLACVVLRGALCQPPGARAAEPEPAAKTPQLTAEQQARLEEANQLDQQMFGLYRQGKAREALVPAKKVLEIRRGILGEKDPGTATSIYTVGFLLHTMGDYKAARPYYDQALAIRKEVLGEKHPDTANSINTLGALLKGMGDFAAARPYYEQALAINREVLGEKHPNTATSLNNMGLLLQATGDYAAARPYLEQSLAINKEVLGEKNPDYATSLNNMGALFDDMGDYASARPYYEQALAILKQSLGEKHPTTANALNNLGLLLQKMGEYTAARRCYQRALEIRIEVLGLKNPDTATSLNNLGYFLAATGNYQDAVPYYERALAIRKEVFGEKHPLTALSLNNLGHLFEETQNYATALPYYEQALAINRGALGEGHPATALALNNLGLLRSKLGDDEAARPYIEQALAIRVKALGEKHPDTTESRHNVGILLERMGDFTAARPYLEQALAVRTEVLGPWHPDTAQSHDDLAVMRAALGQWPEAAAQADQSRRIVRRHIARVLPGLSAKGQLAFLHERNELAFHVGLSLGLHERQDPALAALSAGWLLNGKAVAQESLAEGALLVRETKDPALAADAKALVVLRRQLATLSMSMPKPGQEEAWQQKLDALQRQERDRSRELTQAGGQAERPEPWIELDAVRRKLPPGTVLVEIARIAMYNFVAKSSKERWQPDHYAAWIIPTAGQGDVSLVDLGEADAIDAAVKATRRTLMQPSKAARRGLAAEEGETEEEKGFREAPTRLASLVLHPIVAQIGTAKRLIVSPDAALWLIPWGALPLADGRYAIEEYLIDYAISGRDLIAPHAAAADTSKPVVMADPDFDLSPAGTLAATQAVLRKPQPSGTNLLAMRALSADRGTISHAERLPGTAKEAQAIAPKLAAFAGQAPTLYVDRYALEGIFKSLVSPKTLVLSTHGFFLADQPLRPGESAAAQPAGETQAAAPAVNRTPIENPLLRCGLLLAGCNQRRAADDNESDVDDGILTGMEIIGTDLRGTELVVLSACETGLGEVHNGEGVAGLRQAFQLAGAEAVVASLWQVPDAQTAELMEAFFGNLSEGQSKADALRTAQLAMINTHRKEVGGQPFYWAAFTLTERGMPDAAHP